MPHPHSQSRTVGQYLTDWLKYLAVFVLVLAAWGIAFNVANPHIATADRGPIFVGSFLLALGIGIGYGRRLGLP